MVADVRKCGVGTEQLFPAKRRGAEILPRHLGAHGGGAPHTQPRAPVPVRQGSHMIAVSCRGEPW
jgi:hypothetical protein